MRYYQWITWGFGGVIPPLLGPFMMYQQRKWNIAYCFYVMTGISVMFLIAAPFIPTDANAVDRQKEGHGFKKYVSLQIQGMKQALKIKPLSSTLRFYFLVMMTTPSFSIYLHDLYDFTNDWDIGVSIGCLFSLTITTICYKMLCENTSSRNITLGALCIQLCSYAFSLVVFQLNLQEWYLGGFLQSTLLDMPWFFLLWLPAYVQVTKMCPSDVESIFNAVIYTMFYGSFQVVGRILGLLMTQIFKDIGMRDKANITLCISIAVGFCLMQMHFRKMLPTRA